MVGRTENRGGFGRVSGHLASSTQYRYTTEKMKSFSLWLTAEATLSLSHIAHTPHTHGGLIQIKPIGLPKSKPVGNKLSAGGFTQFNIAPVKSGSGSGMG